MKLATRATVGLAFVVLCAASAQDSKWSIDRPLEKIPDRPLQGQLFGKEFKLKSATLNNAVLTLSSDGASWPEGQLNIFIRRNDLKPEVVVTADAEGTVPHIHMKFMRPGQRFPRVLMYTQEYSMRLTTVSQTETEFKGRIHVSLPDYHKSYLVGSFTAQVK